MIWGWHGDCSIVSTQEPGGEAAAVAAAGRAQRPGPERWVGGEGGVGLPEWVGGPRGWRASVGGQSRPPLSPVCPPYLLPRLRPPLGQLAAPGRAQPAQPRGRPVHQRGQHLVRGGAGAGGQRVPHVAGEEKVRYRYCRPPWHPFPWCLSFPWVCLDWGRARAAPGLSWPIHGWGEPVRGPSPCVQPASRCFLPRDLPGWLVSGAISSGPVKLPARVPWCLLHGCLCLLLGFKHWKRPEGEGVGGRGPGWFRGLRGGTCPRSPGMVPGWLDAALLPPARPESLLGPNRRPATGEGESRGWGCSFNKHFIF